VSERRGIQKGEGGGTRNTLLAVSHISRKGGQVEERVGDKKGKYCVVLRGEVLTIFAVQ